MKTALSNHENKTYLPFTDGSAVFRPDPFSRWEVVCGPDGREDDLTSPSTAVTFAAQQNRANRLVYANAVRLTETNGGSYVS